MIPRHPALLSDRTGNPDLRLLPDPEGADFVRRPTRTSEVVA